MKYEKTEKYNTDLINQKIMGPNPLKLEEELMKDNRILEKYYFKIKEK